MKSSRLWNQCCLASTRKGFLQTPNVVNLNPQNFSKREKQILSGLFLAKFDSLGLNLLGFGSFTEAFNVIGFALAGKPASIKNYRDEFDPLFPDNPRSGWHKRPTRDYCLKVMREYEALDPQIFSALIRSFVDGNDPVSGADQDGGQTGANPPSRKG